ncbi:MAG TPA: thermonuclease family protein [Methyloceanibacter sp.]
MTAAKDQKPLTEAQSSRALAQMLGKFAALVILLILALLIERYCSIKPEQFGPDAKIVSIDGDTLRVGDGSEYRLFGIDTPELHQTCKESNGKSWACGRAAKARLTTLIKGGNVQCQERSKDRYGRVVAMCSAQGVPDLGQALVSQGYAIDLGGETGNPYQADEEQAKTAKRGIWRGTFERPSDWRQAHPRL